MRNLGVLAVTCKSKPSLIINDGSVDKISGDLWVATNMGIKNVQREWDSMSYFCDKHISKIAYLNLPIMCVQCDKSLMLLQLPDQILECQDFDEPLQKCAFSPDLTVGVVLTEYNNVFIISSSLEIVRFIDLVSLRSEKTSFVNVGWGKDDTQFKGTKRIAEKTVDILANKSPILPSEISWREDGKFVAVSWVDVNAFEPQRRLHIFDINGNLHSVGANTQLLETGLCWRPRVQLIAISKRYNGKCLQVAFYELNGLQHGDVCLLSTPVCDEFCVGKITFDSVEHIMAVLFLPLNAKSAILPIVKLYTTSNYHWSVKAELSLLRNPNPSSLIPLDRISLSFGNVDEVGTCTLHTTVSLGPEMEDSCYSSWSLVSCINRSAWRPDTEDPAIVAVIDGCNVSLTAFAHTSIPPPMCATLITFPCAVGAVSLSPAWPEKNEESTTVSLFVQHTNVATAAPWILTLATDWRGPRCFTSAGLTVSQKRQQAATKHSPSATNAWALNKDNIIFTSKNASSMFCGQLLHATWISPRKLCFVSQNGLHLCTLSQITTGDTPTFEVRCLASLPDTASFTINGLVYGPNEEIALQVGDGGVYIVSLKFLEDSAMSGTGKIHEFSDVPFANLPFACDQLNAVTFSCLNQKTHQTYLVGLQSSSYRLCVMPWTTSEANDIIGECLMRSCSSLAIHSNFLLATNLESQLFIVPLALEPLEFHSIVATLKKRLTSSNSGKGGDDGSGGGFAPRALESGARLLAAVAHSSKVVLQMPRGNLEVIHPRALVFSYLAPIFDSLRHADAAETMSRHRINFNLLYDYNPGKFLSNIANFVRQVASLNHIVLLVSDLSEEDITKTEYNGFFKNKQPSVKTFLAQAIAKICDDLPRPTLIESHSATKVNLVCEALLEAMLPETEKFILPILTCYAKKQPQEVEKGLAILKDFKDQGSVDVWERGLHHLQYYLSPIKLFHIALGTYDLDLAGAMAERTQLDPKEYQPCLQQLRDLCSRDVDNPSGIAYQQAQIDLLLQRYSRAVHGLYKAGTAHWKELCEVVNKQKIFPEVLDLLKPGTPEYSEISRLWAKSLIASHNLVAAGEVHLHAGHFASAALLFLSTNSTHLWRLAVARSPAWFVSIKEEEKEVLSSEEVSRQASILANNVRSLERFQEAVLIYSEYLHDYETAVATAAEGGLWLEARRLALQVTDKDLVTTLLKPAVLRASEGVAARMTSEAEEFRNSFERLLEVRKELKQKAASNIATGLDDEFFNDIESELFSDTSSVVSGASTGSRGSSFSKISGRSRKTRRKRERKKWSTKRGSKFEEVALIQVLHTAITIGQGFFESVRSLIDELWRCGESMTAVRLCRQANSLLLGHRVALNIVWCSEITGMLACGDDMEENETRPVRRYPFHEAFMLFPPVMTIRKVNCDFL